MGSSSCGDLSPSVCVAFQGVAEVRREEGLVQEAVCVAAPGVAEVCQEECLVQIYVVESCTHAWMASSECGLLRADNSSHKGCSGSYFNGDLYTAATDVGVLEIMLKHPYSAISGVLRTFSYPCFIYMRTLLASI